MQLHGAMLIVKPQRPRHSRQRLEQTAVHGHQIYFLSQRLGARMCVARFGACGQLLHDPAQQTRIKDPRGLRKTPQTRAADPEFALNVTQAAGLLDRAQTGQGGIDSQLVDQEEQKAGESKETEAETVLIDGLNQQQMDVMEALEGTE